MRIINYSVGEDVRGSESVFHSSDLLPEDIIGLFALGNPNAIGFVGATPAHEDEAEQLSSSLRRRRQADREARREWLEERRAR